VWLAGSQLPASITTLRNMHTLNLYNCGAITFLHDNFHQALSLKILSLQGCEKLKEVPPSLGMAPALATLTLWNCIALEVMPDLSTIPKLQIDGIPEQLADWEGDQKRKRLEAAAQGRNLGNATKAPTGGGWKDVAMAALGGDPNRAARKSVGAAVAGVASAAMSALGGGSGGAATGE
jgi:hypothetical protein